MKQESNRERYERLNALRKGAKTTTYSATYKVGKLKLARTAGISKKEAQQLLDAFWDLNWAVKKVEDNLYVKILKDGSMWLKNPVSGFFYSLRTERDKFSTLNQGTGVYCFDTWVMFMRKSGVEPCGQFHDEVVVSNGDPEYVKGKLQEAITKTNEKLQLNVELKVDAEVGENYADVH